jgi:NADPH:quinone reductase-like Zn-dependent oxidoreductase
MKAVVGDTYGTVDVLDLREIEVPAIAADEVLVRVRAAGVDRGVWHLLTGLPYPVRFAGYGVRAPKTLVPGMDLAGVVEAVGDEVTRFRPGDEVFGIGTGAYAEYARAAEGKLAHKPANVSFEQAASVGISGSTALQGLRDRGRVGPGQKVLILGASGGVGSYAVQLAKAFGAEVTGVCSTAKLPRVRGWGADHVIDYTRTDIADQRQRFDVILDIGGNRPLSDLRRALTRQGTLVIVGGETGGRWLGGYDRMLRAPMLSMFVGQTLGTLACSENSADLEILAGFIETGTLSPVIDRTFSLVEAGDAIVYLAAGRACGKVVVTI